MEHKPILIFDYDGTLHQTMRIYKPAVAYMLRYLQNENVRVTMPSDDQISSWLGMNTEDMWEDFLPDLPDRLKRRSAGMVGDFMLGELAAGNACWYEGAEQCLKILKDEGYRMAVLSNCGISYARAHWDGFGMERYFEAFFECETYGQKPKKEILKEITSDYQKALKAAPVRRKMLPFLRRQDEYIVIGDRDSDLAAAKETGQPMIGCLYGYGTRAELEDADLLIQSPAEIAGAVARLTGGAEEAEAAGAGPEEEKQ